MLPGTGTPPLPGKGICPESGKFMGTTRHWDVCTFARYDLAARETNFDLRLIGILFRFTNEP